MPAANMTLSFGLFSLPAKVAKAIDDEIHFSNLCIGQPEHEGHTASPVRQPWTCGTCGPITDTSKLVKGEKQGTGTYAVVSAEQIEEAKQKYANEYLKKLDLVPVPAGDFLAGTVAGDSLNFLTPANVGDHNRYQLMLRLVGEHPELAFVGLYTPKSVTHLYRVTVLQDCLVMEERVKSDRLRQVPEVGGEVDEAHYGVAEASLAIFTQEWDPKAYEDQYQETLRQMIAVAEVISTAGDVTPTNESDNQVVAILAKQLEKLAAAKPKKTATRKAAAKKTTSARAKKAS